MKTWSFFPLLLTISVLVVAVSFTGAGCSPPPAGDGAAADAAQAEDGEHAEDGQHAEDGEATDGEPAADGEAADAAAGDGEAADGEPAADGGTTDAEPAAAAAGGALKVDTALAKYSAAPGVSGSIKSVGSDTMNNMMALWLEGFKKMYPNVQYEIEGKGSGTAPPALISGTATFGPMSRAIKSAEIDEFEKKFGYKPVQVGGAIDMLAVYVHKDNPVKSLSLKQVDAIFSATRKRGGADVKTWGELGLKGEWANKPISVYGRNSASGTYGFFKKKVLLEGDFKNLVKEQPGSSAVVQSVASDMGGIGYSGIGYKTADVRAVPLSEGEADAVAPTAAEAYSGRYPLARMLWLTVNYRPNSQLDPLRREFVKYLFSQEGQAAVIKDGYFPVNGKLAEKSLAELGLAK